MNKHHQSLPVTDVLFDRIVSILEQARGNVVRAVNTNMVLAYWLIGREIVQNIQAGGKRAEYGKQMLSNLSTRLTQRYGNGFSVPNLQNFRKFYLAYPERCSEIPRPLGVKSTANLSGPEIPRPMGAESGVPAIPSPTVRELTTHKKSYPLGTELPRGFSTQLSWSTAP